jgi:TP901 family phage tail tape measure protein
MSTTLADVQIRIGAEITQFQKGLRSAERELERTAARFNSVGNNLSLALTLPLAAAGAAAFKFATGFETATVKIENLVGVQGQELEDLKNKFKELGPVVGKTQTELADAALFIAGAGLRGAEGLSALEQSAKASTIGLGLQTEVAKVAGAAVTAYGDTGLTAAASIDKLLSIVKEGNAEAADLAPALGTVLPIASALGVSFDEVGANIATFTKLGVGASTAVDGLKSLLGNLLKPSEQASKELAKIGLTADDVRKSIKDRGLAQTLQDLIQSFGGNTEGLSRVFGDVQGLTAVLATAGAQGDVYAETLKNIQNSAGGVDAAFKRTAETAEFKLQKAFASLNAAGTEFGAALVPALVAVADALVPIAQGFASLDPAVQKIVVGFGLAAAAAGPLFKVLGTGIQTFSIARSAALSLGKAVEVAQGYFQAVAPAVGNMSAALGAAGQAWKALDTVAKATVIGAALAVVVALGFAFVKLTDSMGTASKVQASLNEVTATAQKNILAEKLEAERLIGVINSNAASYDDKLAAQKRLQAISPEFFSNLSLEEKGHNANTAALQRYTAQLLTAAKAQAAQEKIVELERERLDILQKIPAQAARAAAGAATPLAGLGSLFDAGSNLFNGGTLTLAARQKEIDAQIKALSGIATDASIATAKLQNQATATVGAPLGLGAPLPTSGGNTTKAPKADTFDGFKNTKAGLIVISDQAQLTNGVLEKLATKTMPVLTESTNAYAVAASIMAVKASDMGDSFLVNNAEIERQVNFLNALSEAAAGVIESGLENTLIGVGEAIGGLLSGASNSGSLVGLILEPIIGMVEQLGKIAIATGIAVGGIKKALETLNPIAAIAAGIGLIAISKIARSQLKNLQPKAFADGGLVYGPTYSLTGEYPGARNNPEVIAPLSKLKAMISDSGGGGAVQVYGRLYGGDILLSSERSDTRRARTRGY